MALSFKFIIKRTNPVSPKLVDDTATNGGAINTTTNTKTAFYEGKPVVITMSKDFGAGIIGYTYDDTVTLKSRSQHGKEGTGGRNIEFQCSTAGTHIIKLKILQPTVSSIPWPGVNHANGNTGATMVPSKMAWSDTTATEITFTLRIELQNTNRPSMVRDDGVDGYGRSKTVNYTGAYQTISFQDADPNFVGWSANGLIQESWDGNTLVLKQKERGTYNIQLYLKNPAGVSWKDGTTDSLEFTFKINEMLIERPTQVGSLSYSKVVKYSGKEETLKISPAFEEQLTIIASGLRYEFADEDGDGLKETCIFKMTDSGTVTIMVMPAAGYIWKDKKTDNINFTFTIEAVEIDVPRLQGFSGTSKTVTFDPTPGWAGKLVIENIPKDAISVVTAMTWGEEDWVPAQWDDRGDDLSKYTEFERNVLTLSAINANTYPVTFTLTSANYRWKVGASVPSFNLIIERYKLKPPKIDQYEYDNNKDKIEGATKTVYYNTDVNSGNFTPNTEKYFKIYAGGFTANNQVTIRYSKEGLCAEWPNAQAEVPTPDLVLWGTTTPHGDTAGPAGNYIIYITPTSNYIWDTGNDDMYTFKFVITPIMRDQLRLYVQQGGEGGAWVIDGGDRTGTADYDGTTKYFRIGNPDNASQYFYESQSFYHLVNQAYEPVSPFGGFNMVIDDKYSVDEHGNKPMVLMCSAVEAGTYIIRLRLKNKNYAWRDGSGVDIYYTFTIKAKSIADPEILGSECSGGSEGSLEIYDTYIHCGFNGFAAQLVISVNNVKNAAGDSIIKVFTNPSGTDIDPDTGKDALQQLDWGEADEEGIARLILQATIVGNHRVLLMIEDDNFKWATDCEYYAFELRIDYAEVDDVLFNYGLPDDMDVIGGNGEWYEEEFNPESSHFITVTRSSEEFKTTPFNTQFIVEVNYREPSYEMKQLIVNDDSFVLQFYDANTYYISIYLTNNYRWRSNHRQDTPVQLTFQVFPKPVSLPQIIDDDPQASVDNSARSKTVTYDTNTIQNIALDFGNDYKAYAVDESQNYPSTLKNDTTIVVSQDKKVRYTAKNAGTYKLALTLSNSNNYSWLAGDTVFYQLIIEQRAIPIPDAFYIDADDLDKLHEDYLDIKNGVKGVQITDDGNGEYKTTQTYDTDLHYIYLFGYAVENKEVTITITPSDPSTVNEKDIDHGNVSVGGVTRGHYAFARTVNTYTISVAFNLNEEFGKPNCHWSGVSMTVDTDPREYTLVIEKLGLDLPELVNDPTQAWVDDSLSAHFTYDGLAPGPKIEIANCLSSLESSPYMSYVYDETRTEFGRDINTNVGTFGIFNIANVGVDYILTIKLDPVNEYWILPSGDTTDVKDKKIKIIMDKRGVAKPVVVDEGDGDGVKVIYGNDGVTTDLVWKSVIYNGKLWNDAMRISGFNSTWMTWEVSSNATTRTEDGTGDLILSTNSANAGSYTVTISLRDPQNYKWDLTTDNSDDRVLSFIIEPKKIPKPTIIINESDIDPNGTFTSTDNSSTIDKAESVYMRDFSWTDLNNIKGLAQTIVIDNFLLGDPDGTMTVVTSSADKFATNDTDETNGWLVYTAVNAGTYTLKFSLSGNVAWDDGTGTADHFITLIINKKEYTAPSIADPGATLTPPVPTVSADGLTRTVTYNFNPQQLIVNGYDNTLMTYHGKTDNSVTGEEFIDKTASSTQTTYEFEATGAGEYTATFSKRNFLNECWTGVTGSTITFKFVIEKLQLETPVVDNEYLLNGENVSGTQFVTTYDTKRHSALALNVLGTDYMSYRLGGDYNTSTAPDTFIISNEAIDKSFSGSVEGGDKVLDKTVNDIFNVNASTKRDGEFAAAGVDLTSFVDKENFILMEATEPGTYEVVFTLANKNNLIWKSGNDTDKKVTFKIEKVKLTDLPEYKAGTDKSVSYTGSPIKFYIAKADNGMDTATSTPLFIYETMTVRCVDNSTNTSMHQFSWFGKELVLEATEIGIYEVKIQLNEKYVQWNSSTPVKTFTFSITKSALTPEITYGDPIYLTDSKTHNAGDPDTFTEGLLTAANATGGPYKWAKSTQVTATVKIPNIRVKASTGDLDVDGLAIEVYYKNPSSSANLVPKVVSVPTGKATAALLATLPTAPDNIAALDDNWSVHYDTVNDVYSLIYKYVIETANSFANSDGITLKRGNYTLYVVQNNTSNSYVINTKSSAFEIEADPSPFTTEGAEKYLIWEVYKASDMSKPFKTYTLADFDPVNDFDIWGKPGVTTSMQPANAIELDYIENDSYVFKVYFDNDGLVGPDISKDPAVNFMDALARWEVKWNGIYGGNSSAKYASNLTPTSAPYQVSVTIQALDPDAYSFPSTTYTFYYHINPILYDLKGVEWDYDSKNPFVYDGTNHTVKLKNLPAGLSVASYDVTGYDRNVQIYAKSEADHGKGSYYETHVEFTTSNQNYVIPVEGDTSTYKDTTVAPAKGFAWFVKWEIMKAEINVVWQDEKNDDGTTSSYVPRLKYDSNKVTYTYFKDNGDPDKNNWPEVTSFVRSKTEDTAFRVIAKLKTNPDDPALDYANNYKLDDETPHDFVLGPATAISVEMFVGNFNDDGTPDVPTFGQVTFGDTPDEENKINTFIYNEKPFKIYLPDYLTADTTGIATILLDVPDDDNGDPCINIWDHVIITYYNTVNKYRPIAAPTDPGHYMVKLQLTDLPDDGNSYELAMNEFYFDIVKGTIDPDSYYWRYTHTEDDGIEVTAIFKDGKWIIHHTSISILNPDGTYSDPADPKGHQINSEITEFVFNTKTHTVELFSENTSILMANTRNKSGVNAGEYKSTASFSYNGKLWKAPDIPTTFDWKIEKKTLSLSEVKWADYSDFMFTVKGGSVKTFTMSATGLDPLLISYISYVTYKAGDATKKEISNTQSDAGKYVTELVFDEKFAEANPNYQLGTDWPTTIPNPIEWEIARREIDVPFANGSWTEYDGNQHDLLEVIKLNGGLSDDDDWSDYFSLVINYDDGTSSYVYDGSDEFGNEFFASHAGKYIFSFSLNDKYNASVQNVVWKVSTGVDFIYTTDDQEEVIVEITKATINVDDWNQNDEASTAVLSGNYQFNYNQFVDYKYYYNLDVAPNISVGNPVELIDVLSIDVDTQFVIEVFVKDAYTRDLQLVGADTDAVRLAFKMLAPSLVMADQIIVQKMPYIEGYITDGVTTTYTDEDWRAMFIADVETFSDITEDNVDDWLAGLDAETLATYKSKIRVNVTYDSAPITFIVHDWTTGATYKNHLNIWQGDLTQNAAGDYSVTFMFVKDLNNPRCWSAVDYAPEDGIADEVDRSPVTLNFRISFRMIPTFKDKITANFPTYTGSELDILQTVLGEEDYDKWIAEYGKYFDIIGSKGTEAGGYTLQLKIKDEYLNTIHWDNNTPIGQPGTFIIKWKILPIYLVDPNGLVGNNSGLIYDGKERTVFEVLGYQDGSDATEEIAKLRQYANITGDRGVDAATYNAVFTLLNTNYAWWNPTTNAESTDQTAKREIAWIISPKPLDLTNIAWGYKDPFQYTLDGGEAQGFNVELTGIPEELKEFITYLTDGDPENSRSQIGTYRTVVYFFENDVKQSANYSLTGSYTKFLNDYPDPDGFGFASIEWQIIEHRFSIPKDITVDYSGTLRDIVGDKTLFNFAEGWENYFDVTIRYKEYGEDDDKFVNYFDIANTDEVLDYSMFNALYTGDYEVTFSIKPEVNETKVNVVWYDGNNHTGNQTALLIIKPKEIAIDGWKPVMDADDANMQISATIDSADFDAMTAESKALFEYVIRDKATGEPVNEATVKASGNGIYYTVEFRLIDPDSYSAKHGFEIVWAEGVKNPCEFINENYGAQPVIWVPIPTLTTTASDTYDGKDKVYNIENANAYALTDDMKATLQGFGVDTDGFGTTLVQAVGQYAGFVDFENGVITVNKAGEFSIMFRQLANVNISWYDPEQYEVDSNTGKLCVKGGSALSDAAAKALIDRNAQSVEISIKKASVDYITDEMLEIYTSLIPNLEYTGKEYNLLELDETKTLFDMIRKTYGDLVTFEGHKATDAGEHILRIALTDPESSFWNFKVQIKDVVNDKAYPGYDGSYSLQYVKVDGKWVIKYLNAKGEEYNGGNYKVENVTYKFTKLIESYVDMDGLVDENGKPLDEGKYEVDENGVAVRYSLVGGNYVADAEGTYIAKYKLRADGTVAEVQDFDSEGRGVIDTEKTQVTVSYTKTGTDPFEIKWYITTQMLTPPTLNEDIVLRYNGAEQRAESVLKGFNSTYMEIVEGGIGKDAGEYTAKIGIKDENFQWRDGEEFVYVTWHIEKTEIDWTGVTWKFTDGTNDYKNGEGMIYTRVNDKATVYWVQLVNLPQALQGNIKYITNGKPGAYAGRDAGKYHTTFEIIGLDKNFENVTIPESIATIDWSIGRRLLDVPEAGMTQFIFDDDAHDLLSALKLPENWEEYISINVLYASNFITFVNYEGHDGNPYEAYGAGAYKFVLSFKDGINTYNIFDSSKSQINVAWAKPSIDEEEPPVPPAVDEEVPDEEEPAALLPEEEVIAEVIEETAQPQTVVEQASTQSTARRCTEFAKATEVQHVCDRIKRIICCTEDKLLRKQY